MMRDHDKRFYVYFLAGPSNASYLSAAWFNLVFSAMYYLIFKRFFKYEHLTDQFLFQIIFCVICLLWLYLINNKHHYLTYSMMLVVLQMVLLLFNIDLMWLLMVLSGFNSVTFTPENIPFVLFVISIGIIFLLSMISFIYAYRTRQNPKWLNIQVWKHHHLRIGGLFIVIIFIIGILFKGIIEIIFGFTLAIICTIVFSALIVDTIYALLHTKQE